ncbi:unnamed protein product [Citrullus colocynthis]|uniref:Secreted protein n=1 Tax=Citrullus colocynthis TaxID=252529 RepID=A0ABP0YSB8_9ROSI
MSRNLSCRSSDFVLFSASLSLLFVSALSDDSSNKASIKSGNHPSSSRNTGSMVAIILFGILITEVWLRNHYVGIIALQMSKRS